MSATTAHQHLRLLGICLAMFLTAALLSLYAHPPAQAAGGAGSPDATFGTHLGSGFTNDQGQRQPVLAAGRQSDGGIIVGGPFTKINGISSARLARLNPDGTPDAAFSTNLGTGFDGLVKGLAVAPDDSVFVTGQFTQADGHGTQVARVRPDGTIDSSFLVDLDGLTEEGLALALQPNGGIIVGGSFAAASGGGSSADSCRMLRLSPTGAVDTAFGANLGGACGTPAGFNNNVEAVAVNPDGSIVAGGQFTAIGNHTTRLAKVSATGVPDTNFFADLAGGLQNIYAVAVQSTGDVVFGGSFEAMESGNPSGGPATCNIARVRADSTSDAAFSANLGGGCAAPGGFDDAVNALAVMHDDSLAVVGQFTQVAGTPAGRVALLDADGSPAAGYNTNTGSGFDSLGGFAVTAGADGSVVVGGLTDTLSGGPAPGAGRLMGATPTLTAIQPTSGPTAGGTTVVLTGTNLIGATSVTFGAAAAASFTVDSATQITAVAPPGAAGQVDVRVATLNGAATLSGAYTYVPLPTPSAPPTATPTSSPTPSPSDSTEPDDPGSKRTKTVLRVKATKPAKRMEAGKWFTAVKRVKSNGKVKIKTKCRVGPAKANSVCAISVRKGQVQATSAWVVRIKPRCNDKVSATVRISAKAAGAQRAVWQRTWMAKKRPAVTCRANANG